MRDKMNQVYNKKFKPTGNSEIHIVERVGTKEEEAEKYRLKNLEDKK